MIDASQFFFEQTGAVAKVMPVSITMKSGQKVICQLSMLTAEMGLMFCPMLLIPTQVGMRFLPYDICTDDLFVPVDSASFQTTSKMNGPWEKIWEKYAIACVKSMPLTNLPEHGNFFKMEENESVVH